VQLPEVHNNWNDDSCDLKKTHQRFKSQDDATPYQILLQNEETRHAIIQ